MKFRMVTAVEEAVRRYPEDPMAWYALGNSASAATSRGPSRGRRPRPWRPSPVQSRWIRGLRHPTSTCRHCSWLWGARRRPGATRLPTWPSTRPLPTHSASAWRRCCWTRVRPAEPRRSRCSIRFDPHRFRRASAELAYWPDTAETAIRVLRRLGEPGRGAGGTAPWILDSVSWPKYLAHALAFRGHLREAFAVNERLLRQPSASPWSRWFDTFHDLSLLGIVPDSLARATYGRSLQSAAGWADEVTPRHLRGLPWWLSRGDTVALARFAALAARMARAPTTPRAALRARLLERRASRSSIWHGEIQ